MDQSQLSFNTGFPFDFGNYPNYPVGQSFTAGLSGLLTKIQVASNGGITDTGTLSLELRSGDGVGGALLGSVLATYGPNSYDFGLNMYPVDVDVSSLGITLTAGSQYTFLFTNVNGAAFPAGFAYRGILANDRNPYAGGRSYSGPGYGNFVAPWDLEFRTFVDTNPAPAPTSVPEPSSLMLLGVGLVGVVTRLRRSN